MTFNLNIFLLITIQLFFLSVNAESKRVRYNKIILNSNGSFSLEDSLQNELKNMKILIAVTVNNHAHSLPTFLAYLESLKCPNENKKCDLWIIFDNCEDNSYELFVEWLSSARPLFDSIIMINTKNDEKTKENHPELSSIYFSKNLKKRAIVYAIERNFTYIFFLKADNIILNPNVIEILIRKQKTIIAPMLTSSQTETSNFKQNIQEENDYFLFYSPIYNRKEIGCFKVHAVQDTYMLDLTDKSVESILKFEDMDENDDLVISYYARLLKISMYVCNREIYGYIPDPNKNQIDSFTHLRIEHLLKGPNKTYNEPLNITQHLKKDLLNEEKTKLGFDQIYIINLERRTDRRKRIESTLNDLGISYKVFKAIDAKKIDDEYIKSLGIKVLPNYKDPYNDRSLNYGEIGCFLSHYFIWKDMIENNYKKIIIFEDDARFVLNFKSIITNLMNLINENKMQWELLYLGRKIMRDHAKEEHWYRDITFVNGYGIIKPSYSHWTISYALTLDGAKKLINSEPLKKLLPVDEYLPIMFDKQPNEYWASFFTNRDLRAYAIQPSIVNPTHYTGEPNHVSDTEYTNVIDTSSFEASLNELKNEINNQNDNNLNGDNQNELNEKNNIHIDL